jgi:hypothetical protein
VVNLLQQNWYMLVTFSAPEFNLKMCSSRTFNIDDHTESSSTYDMITGNVPISSWRIMHNHELQSPEGQFEY